MGQGHSEVAPATSAEQLSQELALIFANQCYTPLELHCFKQVYGGLAESESGLKYWSEATLCGYLEIPDVLGAGPVVHQMATFLASYPFWELSPCILTVGNLLKVVTLLTDRYKKVIKAKDADKIKMLYASMAIVDRRASDALGPGAFIQEKSDEEALEETLKGVSGFSINQSTASETTKVKDEEDTMSIAAFELLKTTSGGALALSERPEVRRSIIPSDNFLKLVELLLFISPLRPQTNLSDYSAQLSEEYLRSLRKAANAVVASFGVEERPGITYNAFKAVVPNSLPYLFNGLAPLFEHFLFDKSFNLSKRKESDTSDAEPSSRKSVEEVSPTIDSPLRDPGEILDLTTLTQLSFFIPSTTMFYRLHYLFSGNQHGFSLGSLEKQVFNWRAPTLLLVRGTLLPDTPANSRERSFADSLPPKRFPNSQSFSSKPANSNTLRTVTYGAYIPTAWKHTHKSHFGDSSTLLFQLSPVHDVFQASAVSKDYVSYNTPNNSLAHAGINFGSPLPSSAGSKAVGHSAHSTDGAHVPLGPVSLYLDDALEYGVFTHAAAGGGSFHPSVSPARTHLPSHARTPSQAFDWSSASTSTAARRGSRAGSLTSPTSPTIPGQHKRAGSFTAGGPSGGASKVNGDWQDRFEIEALEVWGCGGDEEMERQRRRIENEEREARLRKEGIIGRTGDVDVDREILMMAGLIGQNQYGGSIQ